jgi:hypothetical protein
MVLLLSGCTMPNVPARVSTGLTPTARAPITAPGETNAPTNVTVVEQCAFVEGRQQLSDVSDRISARMKEAQFPLMNVRAEAYGENCIASDGHLVRFAARETDYYFTISVTDLENQEDLGNLLDNLLEILKLFPIENTPGPNPGYISVVFQSPSKSQNLWFTRQHASDLISQGINGTTLYRDLSDSK